MGYSMSGQEGTETGAKVMLYSVRKQRGERSESKLRDLVATHQ